MKKKLILLLAVIMVFGISFTSCGGGGGDAEDETGTIKIGWIGSLSGDQAPWGKCESQTLQMLIDEQNENGGVLGRQLEMVALDTKGDANEAVNAVKRLVSQDKVCAVLGPNASAQALAITGVLNEAKVSDIATVATNPKITVNDDGSVNQFNFRVCFTDPYQGAVAGGYAAEVMKYKKAAILYDVASDYSQGFMDFFIQEFEGKGGTIVAKEAFKAGDTDFRPQLTKIKKADPDVILMPYYYKEVALSANQARELGIDATLMGGDGWPSDTLFEMAGDALEGSLVVNHFDYNDPEVKPLTEMYIDKFGTTPEINTYMIHDAFKVLIAAIEKAGSADSEAITAALTQVEVKGVTGTIKLGEDTHDPVGKEAAIQKIEKVDGKYDYIFQQKYSPGK
ncbi:branched-chain amino acid transport system substrate-binding protein [Clostridiales Family XIII bacterium PM5-7]